MKWGECLYILICLLLYFPIKQFVKKTNSYVLFSLLFVIVSSIYVFPLSEIKRVLYNPNPFSNIVIFLIILFTINLIFTICNDVVNKKIIKFICNNIQNIFYPKAIGTPFLEACEQYYNILFASSIINNRPIKYFIPPEVYSIKNNRTLGEFINFNYTIIAIILLSGESDYRYNVVRYCLFHIDDMNLRYFKDVCILFDELHTSRPDRRYMRGYEEVEKVYLREYIMFFARDEKGKIGQIVYERVLQNFPPEYAETINYVRDELKKIQTENKK